MARAIDSARPRSMTWRQTLGSTRSTDPSAARRPSTTWGAMRVPRSAIVAATSAIWSGVACDLALAVGRIGQLDIVDEAVTAVEAAGGGRHVEGDRRAEAEALTPVEEGIATHVQARVSEVDVAGHRGRVGQGESLVAGLRVVAVMDA